MQHRRERAETGRRRLTEKIALVRDDPQMQGVHIADYGTRRRFSRLWHEEVLLTLKEELKDKLAGKLNYYVLGYLAGMGRKKRAAQTDIWRELQFMAAFGLCDCERIGRRFDEAIQWCQRALRLDPGDLYAHYALGLLFTEKFNQSSSAGYLSAARTHFERVIELNPDTGEADRSRGYLARIRQVVTQLGQSGPVP